MEKKKPSRRVGGLDRGVMDADRLEFIRAVDRLRRTRPFPDLTEYFEVFMDLGYSKKRQKEQRDELGDMRRGYEERVAELAAAERAIDKLDAENARLERILTDARKSPVRKAKRKSVDGRFYILEVDTLDDVFDRKAIDAEFAWITSAVRMLSK